MINNLDIKLAVQTSEADYEFLIIDTDTDLPAIRNALKLLGAILLTLILYPVYSVIVTIKRVDAWLYYHEPAIKRAAASIPMLLAGLIVSLAYHGVPKVMAL